MKRSTPKNRIAPPWKMCRTCHRIGVKGTWLKPRCKHAVEGVGCCGQCGKDRPLVTCHAYDFRKRKPAPIARRTRVRKVNRARKAKNSARAYGPKARREWLLSRPCIVCGVEGYTEQAHTRTGGTGRKADASTLIPLCGRDPLALSQMGLGLGCHGQLHRVGRSSFEKIHGVNLDVLAAATEKAWLRHQGAAFECEVQE